MASLLPHLADSILRCRAPPLEAINNLRCPLHCPPPPRLSLSSYCQSPPLVARHVVHPRDCLTCCLLFASVDADCPRLAGVDPAPSSPRHCHVNEIFQRRRSACCLLVLTLIILASLGLNQRNPPTDAENSANTSTGMVQFQYWASISAHTDIGTAAMAFISSMGTCQVPVPVLALPGWRSFPVWVRDKCPYQYWHDPLPTMANIC